MKFSLSLKILILSALLTTESFAALAFPGAVGWGKNVQGGRGGTICRVTNTNSAGNGSLADCVSGSAKRIVVVTTGGVASKTSIGSNKTVFFQTAPGDGYAMKGNNISIGSNTIVRGLRMFGDSLGNGVNIKGTTNVYIDHSSIAWIANEAISSWKTGSDNTTIAYTAIYEGLEKAPVHQLCKPGNYNNPDNVYNAHVLQLAYPGDLTLYRNLWINTDGRAPKLIGGNGNTEVINNVSMQSDVAHALAAASGSGANNSQVVYSHWINNRYKFGGLNVTFCSVFKAGSKLYYSGNNWSGVGWCVGKHAGNNITKANDYIFTPRTLASEIMSANDAEQDVLNQAGPTPRDPYLAKAIQDYQNNNRHFQCEEARKNLNFSKGSYPTDSDNDGIPNSWETANGLNPNNSSDASQLSPDGYMWIEEYANSFFGSTPPPPPVERHLIVDTATQPEGLGRPFRSGEILMRVIESGGTVTLYVGSDDTYSYKTIYVLTGSSWTPYTLSGGTSVDSNFITGEGSVVIPDGPVGDNWVLGYLCHKVGSSYECGCVDDSCLQRNWNAQNY